jgi:hypothetical protein
MVGYQLGMTDEPLLLVTNQEWLWALCLYLPTVNRMSDESLAGCLLGRPDESLAGCLLGRPDESLVDYPPIMADDGWLPTWNI